jgi:hypothetical protein
VFSVYLPYALLLLALIWRALYAYWTPLVNRYIVPPGDDPAIHLARVIEILSGDWLTAASSGYPLGFHILVAVIARVLHIAPLTATIWFAPLLLLLPILAIYLVGKQLVSAAAGAFAALLWATLSLAPVRAFGDGNYPNLLAGEVFVPLALLAFFRLIEQPTVKRAWLTLGAIGLIALFHHLSLVYFAGVAVLLASILLPPRITNSAWRSHAGRPFLYLALSVLGTLVILWVTSLRNIITPVVVQYLKEGHVTGFFIARQERLTWPVFLDEQGIFFTILGMVGFGILLVLAYFGRLRWSVVALLFAWVAGLLLLATVPLFIFTGRFIRELAIPLSLLGGIGLAALIDLVNHRLLKGVVITGILTMITSSVTDLFLTPGRPFALPDPYKPLIRVQHEEEAAIQILRTVASPRSTVLANNSNPYLPFLVQARVIIVRHPDEVDRILAREPVSLLYLGSRPPLTPEDVYPFYALFDEIRARLADIPNKELIGALPTGTTIYRLNTE